MVDVGSDYLDTPLRMESFVYTHLCVNLVHNFSSYTHHGSEFPNNQEADYTDRSRYLVVFRCYRDWGLGRRSASACGLGANMAACPMHHEHVVLLIFLLIPNPRFHGNSGVERATSVSGSSASGIYPVRLSKIHHLPYVIGFSWPYQQGCSLLSPVSNKDMRELVRI